MAGGDAMARDGAIAAQEGRSRYLADMLGRNGEITANDIGHGAQLGDAYCAEALARCGRLVGESLAPLVNLLNPAIIVLGGVGALSGEILLASVREAVYRQSHRWRPGICGSRARRLAGAAGLIGAAQRRAGRNFSPRCGAAWVTLGSPRLQPSFLQSLEALRARQRARNARREPANGAPPCSERLKTPSLRLYAFQALVRKTAKGEAWE